MVEAFCSLGTSVVVFDAVPKNQALVRNIPYFEGNLSDVSQIEHCMELSGATHVIHLISTTLPKSSNDNMVFDIQSNVVSTIRILDLCVKYRCRKILFMSSGGTVYGIPRVLPITEEHPTNPVCSYGISKLAIEKYIHLYSRNHGLPYVILRASNPYGPGQNLSSGQGVIASFLNKVANRQPLQVWGDGSVVRDYFHVRDLADLTCRATSSQATGVFNAGSGSGTSINQLIAMMRGVAGFSPGVIFSPARTFDVPAIVLDSGKAQKAFEWLPKTSLEVGIRECFFNLAHVPGEPRSS